MNILELLRSRGLNPVHVSAAKGGEWASLCPYCGGKDRFHAWPEQEGGPLCVEAGAMGTWWCRGENKGGDMLAYLVEIERMEFAAACRELQIKSGSRQNLRLPSPPKSHQAPAWEPKTYALPSQVWRERAARLVERCHTALLSTPKALAWLAARGLDETAVRRYRLGYLAAEKPGATGIYRPRSAWGLEPREVTERDGSKRLKTRLFLPRGIVIPAYGPEGPTGENGEGELPIRVRIRRPDADHKGPKGWGDKYMVIEGSGMAPLHLGPQARAHVVVEAELDAMLVHHLAGDMAGGGVGALAVLTNLGKPDAAAYAALTGSLSTLVALDYDKAGADGWAWWAAQVRNARRWPTPTGKDPGDMFASGEDIRLWVLSGLPPVYRQAQRQAEARAEAEIPFPAPTSAPEIAPDTTIGTTPEPQPLGASISGAVLSQGEGEGSAQVQEAPTRQNPIQLVAALRQALRAIAAIMKTLGVTYATNARGMRGWSIPEHYPWERSAEIWGRLANLTTEDVLAYLDSHPAETVTADNIMQR